MKKLIKFPLFIIYIFALGIGFIITRTLNLIVCLLGENNANFLNQ